MNGIAIGIGFGILAVLTVIEVVVIIRSAIKETEDIRRRREGE